ncbi:MAG: SurA N-terminal domain-containing protein [Cellulomonas sp.]|nr:SurA N-terminal domain-containing protein [Cellulomonas sp.]
MVVKRGAALAAGLVVVAGLLGGCAQKPGVAATVTQISCRGSEAPPVGSVESDGSTSWSCEDGSVVRGDSTTISTAEVASVVALADTQGNSLTGADAISELIGMELVLRIADEQGITVSDDEAADWLDQQGYESNDGTMVVAKYGILGSLVTDEQALAINAGLASAVSSLDVVVNPRFGTFDPNQFTVLPPTWAQRETLPVGF